MSRYSQFHPLLEVLLTKLADKENTTRDCWPERFDWVKAGCPLYVDGTHPAEKALAKALDEKRELSFALEAKRDALDNLLERLQ